MGKKKGLHQALNMPLPGQKKAPSQSEAPPVSKTASATGAAATSWNILSGWKHPKTPSFDTKDPAANLSDLDRFLRENFLSLCTGDDSSGDDIDEASDHYRTASYGHPHVENLSPRFTDPPPEVIRASERFFVYSSPTGSLIEEARLSTAAAASSSSSTSARPSDVEPPMIAAAAADAEAVVSFSKDPYDDFLRSMQEMVEAHGIGRREPVDWEFMEELLFCYLDLNDRSVHRHIVRAFADLAAGLVGRRAA